MSKTCIYRCINEDKPECEYCNPVDPKDKEIATLKASLDIAVAALKKIHRTSNDADITFDGEILLSNCHVIADKALTAIAAKAPASETKGGTR